MSRRKRGTWHEHRPKASRTEREHPADVDPDTWAQLEAMTPEQRAQWARDNTTPRPPRNV